MFHIGSRFHYRLTSHTWRQLVGDSGFPNVCDMYSVSTANNSVHPQSASDHGDNSFGELARFTYCLLQKIKQGSSLPLVDQWEQYVQTNHSKFALIANKKFLSGTRVLAALNKFGSSYLKRVFRRDARTFLEDFTNSVLSTVAARSTIGQGLSCFCPGIIIWRPGGDDHASLHLLGFRWMGFWNGGGSKAVRFRLVRLSTSVLSQSNDSWNGLQRGAALT